MKVSIVIPNYNGEELLKKNLPKVLETVGDAEVIVVDDASTDGSVQTIKNLTLRLRSGQELKIVRNEKNMGFAATVNRGVEEASGDLIVLLNTDVYPEKDFLKAALPHFKDSKVFAVGFLQKCPENGKIIERGRGVGRFQKGFLVHARGEVDKKNTLWVSGGAGIFRKSIWSELGGFNELYSPFYWEDIDISYRALKTGYKLIFEPKSVVEHQQETTIKSQYSQGKIKTIAYRNQILFVWLNITDFQFILNHLVFLPYHLFKSLVTGNLVFVKAFLMAILKIPYVLRKRWANKKLAVISDEDILR